jgi:succinate dehydrogenase / fumarate reductase, cytochrome b subunit
MNSAKRPLSPHLPIYKVQVTSLFSILHRLSELFVLGLGSAVAILFFWVVCIPDAPYLKDDMLDMPGIESFSWGSCFIFAAFWGISFCALFHGLNTVRYLFWDFGKGFNVIEKTAWAAVIFSFLISVSNFSTVLFFFN